MAKKPVERDPTWIAHKERTAEPRYDKTVFTEVFLHRFANEDARAVRRFGQLVEDATLETKGTYSLSPDELLTQRALWAIVADLRRLEHELAELGQVPEHSVIEDREELKLCRLAARKAFALARIADAIAQAIGPAPQTTKRSE